MSPLPTTHSQNHQPSHYTHHPLSIPNHLSSTITPDNHHYIPHRPNRPAHRPHHPPLTSSASQPPIPAHRRVSATLPAATLLVRGLTSILTSVNTAVNGSVNSSNHSSPRTLPLPLTIVSLNHRSPQPTSPLPTLGLLPTHRPIPPPPITSPRVPPLPPDPHPTPAPRNVNPPPSSPAKPTPTLAHSHPVGYHTTPHHTTPHISLLLKISHHAHLPSAWPRPPTHGPRTLSPTACGAAPGCARRGAVSICTFAPCWVGAFIEFITDIRGRGRK